MLDLTQLRLADTRQNGVTGGCLWKATTAINGTKYYCKCSNYYSGVKAFGDESFYEVICSRLFKLLGFNCVSCVLELAKLRVNGRLYVTHICKASNYARGAASRISLDDCVAALNGNVIATIQMLHLQNQINQMLVADFLTIQRDRHGNNIEVLYRDDGTIQLAPLFDNGLSFLAPFPLCYKNSLQHVPTFDPFCDVPVNNYIGERSLFLNLSLISHPVLVRALSAPALDTLFLGMHRHFPALYTQKIKEIIWKRYNYLKGGGYIIEAEV